MFDAGSAIGKLGLDISEYTHGMLEAEAISSVFPQVVTEFLANPLLGLIEIAKKAKEALTDAFFDIQHEALAAGKAAAMTGVGVEFLSSVAPIAGGIENLADAMKFLQNTAFDSIHGNKELAATFHRLGIDVTDGIGGMKGGEELLLELADAMKDLPDANERISDAMQLMSKSGAAMLPFLVKGADGIRAFGEEQKRLGAVVTTQEVEMAKKVARIGQMWDSAWIGIKATLSEPIFKLLGDNTEQVRQTIVRFSESVRHGIGAVFEHFAPLAKLLAAGFREVGEVVARIAAPAFTSLWPLLRSGFGLIENMVGLITSALAPALKLIEPILSSISRALAVIFNAASQIVADLNSWVQALRNFQNSGSFVGGGAGSGGGAGGAMMSVATPSGGGAAAPTTQPVSIAMYLNGLGPAERAKILAQMDKMLADEEKRRAHALNRAKPLEMDFRDGL